MKRHVVVLSAAVLLPAAAWAGARAANGHAAGSPVLTPARVVGEVLVTGMGVVHVFPEVAQLTLSYKREGAPESSVTQLLWAESPRIREAKSYVDRVVGKDAEVVIPPPYWNERRDYEGGKEEFRGWTVTQEISVTLNAKDAQDLQSRLAALYDLSKTLATNVSPVVYGVSPKTKQAVESEAARLAAIDARRKALDRLPPRHGLGQVLRISDGTRERETVARALPAGTEAALRRASHGGDGPVEIVIQAGKLAFHAVTVAAYELLLLGQRLIPSPDTHPSRRGKARAAGPEQER